MYRFCSTYSNSNLSYVGVVLPPLLFSQISFQLASCGNIVQFLPGFEGPLPFVLETGYVGVGEGQDVQAFYYFIESENNPKEDPLMLWLTGGPGCSALSALVFEIGPLAFKYEEYNGSLPSLVLKPHSWTKVSSIIFVDLPVFTGFTYARTESAGQRTDSSLVHQVHQFLRKWLVDHPEFLSNEVYIGGDSYTGIPIPAIVQEISQGNEKGLQPWINIQGYLLGNAVTTRRERNYAIPFAHGMGLISDELYESLRKNCRGEYINVDTKNVLCSRDLNSYNEVTSGLNTVHILDPNCEWLDNEISWRRSLIKKDQSKFLNTHLKLPPLNCRSYVYFLSGYWANDDNVRKALHIREGSIGKWHRCTLNVPFKIDIYSSFEYHVNLSKRCYRSLVYSGDHDLSVLFLGTQAWIRALNYSIVDDWRQWRINDQVGGYTRTYSNRMRFATVKGGGHTAPEYKPEECFAMYNSACNILLTVSNWSGVGYIILCAMCTLAKYDVFLSFRGADTRNNFISHLYAGLERNGIKAFKDDRSLETGDEISPELNKAIEQSIIYVIVFSKHYASSCWCLNELVKIMDCKERFDHQRHVIPIFYHVDPATVRHQKETYADAFVKHQNRLVPNEVIQRWKDALTQAAGISGWDSNPDRSESNLVDDIAQDILKKLDRSISSNSDSVNKGMVGIDEHIVQIKSLLQLESEEAVRIIGIWGMGGIGKTTLARALYDKLRNQFSSGSLVVNAQQEIDRDGTYKLREKYLSELGLTDERLKRAKVLLILDDVKISSQIQELIGGHANFGQGSRIIVTSRDLQVIKNAEADEIYEVKEMNYQDSLRLFRLRAFKPNTHVEGYADLVKEVLEYAKGVPLALQVLGSLLYDKRKEVWESQLQKLRKLPNRQIINVLKLSYDGLDDEEKDIFLDIACFYAGWHKDEVFNMLDACGFSTEIGMEVLKDRCLISILNDKVMVHDLIREMGKDIVHQQCAIDPGKRSRLWDCEEICNVLKKNKGTDAIQCIFLHMFREAIVQLHPENFKSMPNLRMLYFTTDYTGQSQANVTLPAFLESLPDGLKILNWFGFPQRSLPLCPENLVELNMPHSKLEQLWEDDQKLPNLKRLDLRNSSNLIRTPDLSMFPNIEVILLSDCGSLIEVHSSRFLDKLKLLWLDGCVELRSLNVPSNILSRSSGLVRLYNCCKLKTIGRAEVVESRGRSHFDGLLGAKAICDEKAYINDFRHLRDNGYSSSVHELCWLDLGYCESFTSLQFDLCALKLLKRLCLRGCSNLEKFPEIENTMENLVVLILDGTAIQELPSSLDRLVGLEELSLHKCRRLEIIPSSIGRLTKLSKLNLTCCVSLETFPSSIFKLKLTELDLFGCSKLKTFPEILEPAESFEYISLSYTAIKELPSSLDILVSLETLCLDECGNLESLPNSIGNLKRLSELDCTGCSNLTEIPNDIGRLSSLRKFSLLETGIVNLPESIAHLSRLRSLDVSGCRKLECIPRLSPFMRELLAFDCPSIERVMPNTTSECLKVGTFQFYFTTNEDQDPIAHSDVVADARLRITEDAYRFVYYFFPGSGVPDWFPYRCKGNSVTVDKDSLNWCSDSRLIGFALCFILPNRISESGNLECNITFKSGGRTFTFPQDYKLAKSLSCSAKQMRQSDHTFIWNCILSNYVDEEIFHALSFTFEITDSWSDFPELHYEAKECGVRPLYNNGKYDIDGPVGPLRIANNDSEETSGEESP